MWRDGSSTTYFKRNITKYKKEAILINLSIASFIYKTVLF